MDVLGIEKTGENYRILYDPKGRFVLLELKDEEAKFKLCKIVKKFKGPNNVPYIVTDDARTLRYPHPDIKLNDTIKFNILKKEIVDFCKLEVGTYQIFNMSFYLGNVAYCFNGNNIGRVGIVTGREIHDAA